MDLRNLATTAAEDAKRHRAADEATRREQARLSDRATLKSHFRTILGLELDDGDIIEFQDGKTIRHGVIVDGLRLALVVALYPGAAGPGFLACYVDNDQRFHMLDMSTPHTYIPNLATLGEVLASRRGYWVMGDTVKGRYVPGQGIVRD